MVRNTVDSYDFNLTKGTPSLLSENRSDLAATTMGNYALFGGGSGGLSVDTVDAYALV